MAHLVLLLVLFSPIVLILLAKDRGYGRKGGSQKSLLVELLGLLDQGLVTLGIHKGPQKDMFGERFKVRSYECEEDVEDDTLPARRNISLRVHGDGNLKDSPLPGRVNNLNDVLNWTLKSFGPDNQCIGWRDLIREIVEEKEVYDSSGGTREKVMKKWTYYELTDYKWMSAREFQTLVNHTASGLASLGLNFGDKILMYARTSYKWLQLAHACWHRGIVVVTAYEALDYNAISVSITETEASYIYADINTCGKLAEFCKNNISIKGIILSTGDDKKDTSPEGQRFLNSYKIVTLDDLVAAGKENVIPPAESGLKDTCCIMYTSGTAGGSKGVELCHGNLVSAIAGVQSIVEGLESSCDRYLAYLPMSHVLECVIVNVCLFYGIPVGFGSIWTLNSDSVRNCKSDIQALRPSVMAGVPAVWESMKRNIVSVLNQQSLFRRVMFRVFFNLKWHLCRANIPTGFIDNVIFKRIKEQLGGRLRFVLNGGAPIHPSTKKFISMCAVKIINGYGLTETAGMGAVQYHDDSLHLDITGPPTASVEIKLAPLKDTEHHSGLGLSKPGEIWIRGPSVMKGYYKKSELNKESFTDDGWFKTGDVGAWTKWGTLKIVDRIKNLVKLSNGEYISLDKLDALYKSSPYVENMCVFYREDCPRTVALISPVEKALYELACDIGVAGESDLHDLPYLCLNKKLVDAVYKNLLTLATASNFNKSEIPVKIILMPFRWTPDNKYLTAAFKVSRGYIAAQNKELLNSIFEEISGY